MCLSVPRGLILDYTVDSIVADDIFTGKFVVGDTSVLKSVTPDNVLTTKLLLSDMIYETLDMRHMYNVYMYVHCDGYILSKRLF